MKKVDQKAIGKVIKRERISQSIAIEQMAKDLGIEEYILSEYENGYLSINENDGIMISEYLNIESALIGIEPLLNKKIPSHFYDLIIIDRQKTKRECFRERANKFFHSFRKKTAKEKMLVLQNQLFIPEKMENEFPSLFRGIAVILGLIYLLSFFSGDPALSSLSLSLIVPFSILWFLYELHLPRDINGIQIIKYFMLGGLVSIIYVQFIRGIIGFPDIVFVEDLITGVVEETTKLIVVILLVKKTKIKYISTGILIGFAVGAGFDVFETVSYGMNYLLENNDFYGMQFTIALRSFYAIFGIGHHFWTGMLAGALVSISPTGYLKLKSVLNRVFVIWYCIIAMIHAMWNFVISLNISFSWILEIILCLASLSLFILMWKNQKKYLNDCDKLDKNQLMQMST